MNSDIDAEVKDQLLAYVDQTADFVGVSDPWGRILYLNPAAQKLLGVADATGLTLADLFPLEAFGFYYDVVRPQLLLTGTWSGEILVNAVGTGAIPMYVSTTAKLGPGAETAGGVVYAHKLSHVPVDDIGRGSGVDDPTGLPGRAAFLDRARLALEAATRAAEPCAFVLTEIVHMRELIATHGALVTESVVRALAGRITRVARTIDVVGRVDDHQLGLLLRGVRGHGEALRIARTVYETLTDSPVMTAGGEIEPTVGCGVAFGRVGDEPLDLLERASAAMDREWARRDLDVRAPLPVIGHRVQSASLDEFRVGMSHGDVRTYARPVVDLASGALVGYQGLARWHHRRSGTLEAEAFTEAIAETPLANEVDLYVARETAAVLALAVGDHPLRLYAPASKRLVLDAHTEQYLSEIADAFFLSVRQLHLQLARPILGRGSPALRDALQSLHDADVALVVTGVEQASDVGELRGLPFAELQISRRLAESVATGGEGPHAVSELVRTAHDAGLVVSTPGVDDHRKRDVLIELGCDLACGDLYGGPELATTID